jgi:hypothetical protein
MTKSKKIKNEAQAKLLERFFKSIGVKVIDVTPRKK